MSKIPGSSNVLNQSSGLGSEFKFENSHESVATGKTKRYVRVRGNLIKAVGQETPITVKLQRKDGSVAEFQTEIDFRGMMKIPLEPFDDGEKLEVELQGNQLVLKPLGKSMELPKTPEQTLLMPGASPVTAAEQKQESEKSVEEAQRTAGKGSPPVPSSEQAEKKISKKIEYVDWKNIEFISVPKIDELSPMLSDFYTYDQYLDRPDKPTVLMIGAPGIGKSTVARETAIDIAQRRNLIFREYDDSFGREFIKNPSMWGKYFVFHDLRLTEIEPQDLMGMPRSVHEKLEGGGEVSYVEYTVPLWAQILAKTPGVLMLDELTNVHRDDVLSASFKLMLEKKAGFQKFNDEVMIIAAGNPPEQSSAARGLPAPLVSRAIKLDVVTPNIDDWAKWMDSKYGKAWDKKVYSFLRHQGFSQHLLKVPESEETLSAFPTPRTWTKVAIMLPNINPKYGEIMLRGSVGEEAAADFMGFIKYSPPPLSKFVEDPSYWKKLDAEFGREGTLNVKWLTLVALSSAFSSEVDDLDKAVSKKEEKAAAASSKRIIQYLDLVKVINSDSKEYLMGLSTMLGVDTKAKCAILLSRTDLEYVKQMRESFSGFADMKKLVAEMSTGRR